MNLVPRSTIWPGELPRSSAGVRRPLLAPDASFFVIHYTGGGSWLDPNDTPTELVSIQKYATGANKSWEYNYVVDGQGVVWQYAGEYQAAHAMGFNSMAIGCLLLLGFNNDGSLELPTSEMIQAVRELRKWLTDTHALSDQHRMLPHRQMPGVQTSCPGQAVIDHWPLFIEPILEEDDMQQPTTLIRCEELGGLINTYDGGTRRMIKFPPNNTVQQNLAIIARLQQKGIYAKEYTELDREAFESIPLLVD